MSIFRHATAVLRHPTSSPGQIAVAVVALSEAIHQQLDIPCDTALLLWEAVVRSPDAPWVSTATGALGEVMSADHVPVLLQAALDAASGLSLRDAALDALSGSRAALHVTDHDLLAIAERARGRLVQRAANTIRCVCDHRLVPQEVVVVIAVCWSRRPDHRSRVAVVEDLLDYLPLQVTRTLVEGGLRDEHADVRSAAALRVIEFHGREEASALVRQCLTTETNSRVIAELLSVQAELLVKADDGSPEAFRDLARR
jgi:hypothetical protein